MRDPASGDQVVGQVFTALMPICGQKRDVGLGGGIINKYDACSFTALFLINKSKLVVLDVYVELINVEDGIEVDAGRSGVFGPRQRDSTIRKRGTRRDKTIRRDNNATY